MQTVKRALEAGHEQSIPLLHSLSNFLFSYRTTLHATTGVTLSSLLMGRTLCTRLDLIKPNVGRRVREWQNHQKAQHDTHCRKRQFALDQKVWVHKMREGSHWISGIIAGIQGPVSYLVQVASGDVWHRHVDHIRDGRLCPTLASDGTEENQVPDLDDSLALPRDLSSPSVSSNQDSTSA